MPAPLSQRAVTPRLAHSINVSPRIRRPSATTSISAPSTALASFSSFNTSSMATKPTDDNEENSARVRCKANKAPTPFASATNGKGNVEKFQVRDHYEINASACLKVVNGFNRAVTTAASLWKTKVGSIDVCCQHG